MISKIIHSFAPAKEEDWHDLWKPCYDSWFKCFDSREFKFIMWTHEACDNFIKREFPSYFEFYDNLPLRIMKVDISRLLVLYKFGGIYHDMDVMCHNNFYSFFLKYQSKFYIARSNFTIVEYISNCLMASTPSNSLLLQCVELSKKTIESCLAIDRDYLNKLTEDPNPEILYLTGPILIQNTLGLFFKNYKHFYFSETHFETRWYNERDIEFFPIHIFNPTDEHNKSKIYTEHLGSNTWFTK